MLRGRKTKVVLDANWYISACISRKPRRTIYYEILQNPFIDVFYSAELLEEFEEVIYRVKFAKIIKPLQVRRFKSLILLRLKQVSIGTVLQLVRDEKDDYLLAICGKCKADYLITGDKDLLVMGSYQQTSIVTMSHFLQIQSLKNS
ncbi:putative toxin-antitoxin system toxin component, PIN family [Persicitalea sp.]|uniref:putative toxin-antitoxin system toxin component, PIN family n=1 Tax=Persicitalea sp. TaxID=3100273 RepID=UPI003594153D